MRRDEQGHPIPDEAVFTDIEIDLWYDAFGVFFPRPKEGRSTRTPVCDHVIEAIKRRQPLEVYRWAHSPGDPLECSECFFGFRMIEQMPTECEVPDCPKDEELLPSWCAIDVPSMVVSSVSLSEVVVSLFQGRLQYLAVLCQDHGGEAGHAWLLPYSIDVLGPLYEDEEPE